MNYAVDKEGLIRSVKDGDASVARSFVPPGMDDYPVVLEGYPYDPEEASRLLAEAGYPGGEGLPTLTLYADTDEDHRKVAEYVIGDLTRLGIDVQLKTLEWGAFLDATYNGEAAFFQDTWLADYPDPENFLFVLLHSSMWGSAGNATRYGNEEFDKLVAEASRTTDWDKRERLYRQAEEIAYEDAPWLLLYIRNCTILKRPEVRGLALSPLDRAPVLPGVDLRSVRVSD
jgi:peptide/nickel transport system substrate-binding protein/oligopeptide transport system substrate-binding protein